MKTIYICEKCGQEFENKSEAYIHERACMDEIEKEKASLMYEEEFSNPYGQVVCRHCNNHYFAYGGELNCKYSEVCGKGTNYRYFVG